MEAFELNAQQRTGTGTSESRRLRKQGRVPAIIYGGNDEPAMVSLSHDELIRHMGNEAFFSHVIKVHVDGKNAQDVVLRDMQRHPARPFVEHVDLMRVVADEALRMSVPFHFTGEQECPGVKTEGGMVQRVMTEVQIECLPRDLPEYIEVDVSALNVGDSLHLGQVALPAGVQFVELLTAEEGDEESTIVSVQLPRAAVEEEAEEEVVASADDEDAAADSSGEEE